MRSGCHYERQPLRKSPTLLIDSDALENSNQINDDFKKIFTPEIEAFKREYRVTHPDKSVEQITGDERPRMHPLQKKAIEDGVLSPVAKVACRICGQTEGERIYHCENYDDPVNDAACLCWHCHQMWHRRSKKSRS